MSGPERKEVAKNVRRLARLDLPGGGQVVVSGNYAYVGHLNPPNGTTIVDVSNPRKPKVVGQVKLPDPYTHTHKVRVMGDLMYTNYEQYNRYYYKRGEQISAIEARLRTKLGRDPSDAEIAKVLTEDLYVGGKKKVLKDSDVPVLREAARRGYTDGGYKVYDVSDKSDPKLVHHQRTFGFGSHRFDIDENYIYLSTEWEGYLGNVLVIMDIRDPLKPKYVSHWGMPGQHTAGGETPTWNADDCRVHHGLRQGNEIWVAMLWGGFYGLDVSDITRPKVMGSYNYHPPFPEPTHTILPVPFKIDGKRVAVVADESQVHRRGQPHAGLWFFDISNAADIKPLSVFNVSELDSPWSAPPAWFGCHQFQEHFKDTLVYASWFAGGMRIIDMKNPSLPEEVGYYIPPPNSGVERPGTNDVEVDERGLIYITDRYEGFDILERTG